MGELIFAAEQGRNIPKEDKIFGISNRAKKRIIIEKERTKLWERLLVLT